MLCVLFALNLGVSAFRSELILSVSLHLQRASYSLRFHALLSSVSVPHLQFPIFSEAKTTLFGKETTQNDTYFIHPSIHFPTIY